MIHRIVTDSARTIRVESPETATEKKGMPERRTREVESLPRRGYAYRLSHNLSTSAIDEGRRKTYSVVIASAFLAGNV
jgi:hypothetical protein